MSQLTLRLPETLYRQLEATAKREGVSLNQYIVYALTKQTSSDYAPYVLPDEAVAAQQEQFQDLLTRLGRAPDDEIRRVLAERDEVVPEETMDPEMTARLQKRLHRK
jgi:predicted HicB family RNase H-like nuclease